MKAQKNQQNKQKTKQKKHTNEFMDDMSNI